MPTVVRLIAAATTRQRLNSVFVTYSTRSHDNPLGLFTVMILVCDFFEVIPAVWYRHGTKLCGCTLETEERIRYVDACTGSEAG